jgi:rSAM/selenodomain-associated transferase 2
MRVSVVIPTLHDDAALKELLATLARCEPPPDEVIVVDGAGNTDTAAVCREYGARWIASSRGRGVQLARGATMVDCDVLWFVHADCIPHPNAIAQIRTALEHGANGGYFRFQFGGPRNALQRLLERCIAWRCRIGMVYGDQGLFVKRSAYEASPGFSREPLFEEVELVRTLKRRGRFVGLDLPMIVSPRRWQRDGYLRRTLQNRALACGFVIGIAPSTLARWYGRR